ncbi:STAS domain-containing protein [Streptomyces sp. NPDC058385]|uniref:STAS domain-containing protein n=1 Tax=Streptomyces sp. NPDC058385 TaxID=3346473 RepID=UPI00365E33E4
MTPEVRLVVRPHGELTSGTVKAVRLRLLGALAKGPDVLEVDLRRVTYLSADGCGALHAAVVVARSVDTRLVITHAQPRARAILGQAGLSPALQDDADHECSPESSA